MQTFKALLARQNYLPYIEQRSKLFSIITWNRYHPPLIFTHTIHSQTRDSNPNLDHPSDFFISKEASKLQNLLKSHSNSSVEDLHQALDQCRVPLTDELVLHVLQRHRSDWKPAFTFFKWVSRGNPNMSYAPGSEVYNEMLCILGRMKSFDNMDQVFNKMSKRKGLINESTFSILIRRYCSGHMIMKATEIFYMREKFGFELDLNAFQTLLLSLCRYKHVEVAEVLFHEKKNEFPLDIKTLNIILNGWCVLGNLHEAKRFWKDILSSRCMPDLYTYGIMINSLTNKGKLGTALKLFQSMWKSGITPDVAICNCIIDALCFKKRIPQALDIFQEMNDKGCLPNVATYNSLIKYLCKIRRMEKVYELVDEMEQKKGSCTPNDITFNFLLKSLKKPEEIPEILERMKMNGCEITHNTYNLILRLYMDWNHDEGVETTWVEMEKNGVEHDQVSYTIIIHGLHRKGKKEEALHYFKEMTSKGMIPEPRTRILVGIDSSETGSAKRRNN